MYSIPAYCRACGHAFIPFAGSDIVLGDGVGPGEIVGVTGPPCPRCGGETEFLEGLYSTARGALELLSGPGITRAALRDLGLLFAEAATTDMPLEVVLAQAQAVEPKVATFLRGAISPGTLTGAILCGVISGIIVLLLFPGKPATQTTVIEQVNIFVQAPPEARRQIVTENARALKQIGGKPHQ